MPSFGSAGAGRVARARGLSSGRWSGAFAARCAPALAAGLALATLAAFQADRASAAETAFLALWVTAALLSAAVLAPPPGWEVVLGAPLAVLAAWALPAGPARLAAGGTLLVAVLAVAAGRARARLADASWSDSEPAFARHLAAIVPLALGAQMLLRSELLLAPDARAAALLIVPPVVGAWALGRLAARAGLPAALIGGAAAAALGPGFTAGTTLALLGVAAGAELAARIAGRAASVPAAAAAGAVLLAGLAIETRASAAALAAGGILALAAHASCGGSGRFAAAGARAGGAAEAPDPDRSKALGSAALGRPSGDPLAWPLAGLLLAAVALPAAAVPVALRPLPEALAMLAWVPLLLPAVVLLPALPPGRWPASLAALGLALASALAVAGPAAPAAALAVLGVLVLAPPPAGAAGLGATARLMPALRRALMAAQGAWSAALLAGTALLAAPPWLRSEPATDALALLGLAPGWPAALLVGAAASAIGAGGAAGGRRPVRRPARWAAGLLALALLAAALALPGRPLLEGPAVVLRPERPRVAVELTGRLWGPVTVFTHLSNGLAVPAGTEVATIVLLDGEGRAVERRALRAGADTGEWAARRPDVAALPGIESPPPWAAWVEGGSSEDGSSEDPGTRPFFGQYYRVVVELEMLRGAAQLVIERAPELPAEVLITVHRIEVAG